MDADDTFKETEQDADKPNAIENHEHRDMKPNVSTIDLHVQFGINNETVFLTDRAILFSQEIDVGDASDVVVRVGPHGIEATTFKTLKFKNLAFRKILITVDVDKHFDTQLTLRTASTYKPAAQQTLNNNSLEAALPLLKFNSKTPMTVLTFTSDNLILIQAGKTFTGDKEILAYVWLQCGKVPLIGKYAFDALKTHSDSVFYGITRLLASDFNPDHPDTSWQFKTTRDADGKLLVLGGDDIVTLPIVLFGLVVKSTLLYIKDHQKCNINTLGIRLPAGCVVSDAELKDISPLIGVELILL